MRLSPLFISLLGLRSLFAPPILWLDQSLHLHGLEFQLWYQIRLFQLIWSPLLLPQSDSLLLDQLQPLNLIWILPPHSALLQPSPLLSPLPQDPPLLLNSPPWALLPLPRLLQPAWFQRLYSYPTTTTTTLSLVLQTLRSHLPPLLLHSLLPLTLPHHHQRHHQRHRSQLGAPSMVQQSQQLISKREAPA